MVRQLRQLPLEFPNADSEGRFQRTLWVKHEDITLCDFALSWHAEQLEVGGVITGVRSATSRTECCESDVFELQLEGWKCSLIEFAHQVFFILCVCVRFLNLLLRTDTLHTWDKRVVEQDAMILWSSHFLNRRWRRLPPSEEVKTRWIYCSSDWIVPLIYVCAKQFTLCCVPNEGQLH